MAPRPDTTKPRTWRTYYLSDGVPADQMAHVWTAYESGMGRVLPGFAAALAVFYVVAAVVAPIERPGTVGVVLSVIHASTAVLAGAVAWVTRDEISRRAHSQHAILGLALVVSAAGSMELIINADPRQTTVIMTAVFALGAALLSQRFLVLGLVFTWAMWLGGMLAFNPGTWSLHWLFAMVGASLLSAGVFLSRLRSFQALDLALTNAERLSGEDSLTGLANRRGALIAGDRLVAEARRSNDVVTCLFVDVDGLKKVNDDLNHDYGDAVLRAVAAALREVFRAGDILARWGGDEFVVYTRGPGPSAINTEIRMVARLTETNPVGDQVWQPLVSVGVAVLEPWKEITALALANAADEDMIRRRSVRRTGVGDLRENGHRFPGALDTYAPPDPLDLRDNGYQGRHRAGPGERRPLGAWDGDRRA